MPYKVADPDEFAGQVIYDVQLHNEKWGKFDVTSYTSKLKAELVANFLNALDQIDDDDTEQLEEISGFFGF